MEIELSIPIAISALSLLISGIKYFDKSKEKLAKLETDTQVLTLKIDSLEKYHDEKLANLKEILEEIKERL